MLIVNNAGSHMSPGDVQHMEIAVQGGENWATLKEYVHVRVDRCQTHAKRMSTKRWQHRNLTL